MGLPTFRDQSFQAWDCQLNTISLIITDFNYVQYLTNTNSDRDLEPEVRILVLVLKIIFRNNFNSLFVISQSKIVVSRSSIIKKIMTPYYLCDCIISIDIVHEHGSIIYVCTNKNTIAEDYNKHLLSLQSCRRCSFRDLST